MNPVVLLTCIDVPLNKTKKSNDLDLTSSPLNSDDFDNFSESIVKQERTALEDPTTDFAVSEDFVMGQDGEGVPANLDTVDPLNVKIKEEFLFEDCTSPSPVNDSRRSPLLEDSHEKCNWTSSTKDVPRQVSASAQKSPQKQQNPAKVPRSLKGFTYYPPPYFPCEYCATILITKEVLDQHVKDRHVKREKKAPSKSLFQRKALLSQKSIKNVSYKRLPDPKVYKCTKCHYTTIYQGALDMHLAHKRWSFMYKCHDCKKLYATKVGIERHMVSLHSGTQQLHEISGEQEPGVSSPPPAERNVDPPNVVIKEEVWIEDAPQSPPLLSTLESSASSHREPSSSLEKNSSTTTYSLNNLDHYPPPYCLCEFCGRILVTKEVLAKHVADRHQKQDHIKAYSCSQCDYKALHKGTLCRHVAQEHRSRRLECDYCQKMFATKWEIRRHIIGKHISNTKLCTACGKRYKNKYGLYDHQKRMHPEKFLRRKRQVSRQSGAILSWRQNGEYNPKSEDNVDPLILTEETTPSQLTLQTNFVNTNQTPVSSCTFAQHKNTELDPLDLKNSLRPSPSEHPMKISAVLSDLDTAIQMSKHSIKPKKNAKLSIPTGRSSRVKSKATVSQEKMNPVVLLTRVDAPLDNHKTSNVKIKEEVWLDDWGPELPDGSSQTSLTELSTSSPRLPEPAPFLSSVQAKPDQCREHPPSSMSVLKSQQKDRPKPTRKMRKCPHCDKLLTSKSLARHVRTQHIPGRQFECDYCKKMFLVKCNLRRHIQTHIGDPQVCSICVLRFKNRMSLNNHHLKKHAVKTFQCDVEGCSSSFMLLFNLKRHQAQHSANNQRRMIQCDHCKREFSLKRNLVAHVARKHPSRHAAASILPTFQCEFCEQVLLDKISLMQHTDEKHPKKYKCPLCEFRVSAHDKLFEHIPRAHCGLSFECDHCKKMFKSKRDVRTHITNMHRHFVEVCRICGGQCVSYNSVTCQNAQRHLKKYFGCSFAACGKTFIRRIDLDRHLKEHRSGVTPYECQSCPKRFASVEVLSSHVKYGDLDSRYKCRLCSQSFCQRKFLINHWMRDHADDIDGSSRIVQTTESVV